MFQNIDFVGAMSGVLSLVMTAGWWGYTATRRLRARYATEQVVPGNIKLAVSTLGRLQAPQELPVVTGTTGTILSVDVDHNDPVVSDQVLERLDGSKLENAVQGAAADVAEVQSALARMERLSSNGPAPTEDTEGIEPTQILLDRAEATLLYAAGQLRMAKADLASAHDALEKACRRRGC
jgi:multidrug efflux pump subunit AcrA (membrane-fusion protein)